MTSQRKIYSFVLSDGIHPVEDFIHSQDIKMQRKIQKQFKQMRDFRCSLQPPLVKAFRVSRYQGLYELRTRIRQMVRIIFYINADGDIILLHGFIKNHERATEQALETARVRKLALASGTAQAEEIIDL